MSPDTEFPRVVDICPVLLYKYRSHTPKIGRAKICLLTGGEPKAV